MSTITLAVIFLRRMIIKKKRWYYTTEARSAVPRSFTDTHITVRFTSTRRPTRLSVPPYNATDDSPVRPRGRFTCPRQLTTPWPTRCPRRLTKVTADSPVHTGLPRRGRFTRERLQLHLAIINFMADYFRPGTSGDIHLKYVLLVHIIFIKKQFIFVLVCNIVDAGQLFTTSKRCG